MDNSPALLRPTPPFPPPPSPTKKTSFDWSTLQFIGSSLALIAVPALIYCFFFVVKCPPIPFWRGRRRSDAFPAELSSSSSGVGVGGNTGNAEVVVSDIEYRKDAHAIAIGSECPVCLSAFNDGEEVRQLMSCKHSFHAPCIDLWLHSHSNCPVCRASVHLKHSIVLVPSRRGVQRQASPDSAGAP